MRSARDPLTEQDLVAQLAQVVVAQTAPDEILLFDVTAQEYFSDPDAVLDPRRREEQVGFGLDLAMMTPVVLAVVTPVIHYLLSIAVEVLKEHMRPAAKEWVRHLLGRGEGKDAEAESPTLTQDQIRHVRELAAGSAVRLGMSPADADLLADAVVGGMVVR